MLHRNAHQGPFDASVGTTFSASMSESVDIDIVDQIIAIAREATSFAQVHEAYSSVLNANGIRPSSDKAYYQFLLKLGMIRASSWGERWDVWRAQHDTAPQRPAAKAKLRMPNPMRARVPFLASASSDLDEEYADESDAGSDVPKRESPRKAFVTRGIRSLVGYTPVPSDIDETTFDVPLPVRTSTPVFSQTPHREHRKSSPIPPSYSESELETSRSVTIGPLTPKPRHAIRDISPAVEAEMEAQADAFHRLGLLGRCFEVWLQSEDWIRRTTEQIDSVRNTLLLRQTLSQWRDVHDAQLQKAGTADSHYAHSVQREVVDKWIVKLRTRKLESQEKNFVQASQQAATLRVWQGWRRKLVNRRTEVWAADLKRREKLAAESVQRSLLGWTFNTWRDRTRTKQADVHYVTALAERHFAEWRRRTEQSRTLSDKLLTWEAQHSTNDLARGFGLWRGKTMLRKGERQVAAHRETRVLVRVWSQWRVATTRQQVATAFDDRRVMGNTMSRMMKALRMGQFRQRKAQQFATQRDFELVRSVFNTWTRNERSRLLTVVLDTRRVKTAFSVWKRKVEHTRNLECEADQFAATSKTKSLHVKFNRWRDILGQKRNAALKADLIFEARTKSKALVKLQAATSRATDNLLTADKAYAFFAQRSTFKTWRKKLVRRRLVSFVQKQNQRVLGSSMQDWREATAQSIVDNERVELFQAVQDRRRLASAVSLWTERVVEIKSRELDVAEQRDTTILHAALRQWRTALHRKKDLVVLLQSVLDIKREDSMRRAFLLWAQRARRSRDLRQKAEFLAKERAERQKADAFGRWYDHKRERDLQPIADEVALRHEDALMFGVFDQMLERTPLVRGIQYDQQRLCRLVFPRWQRALQRTRELKRTAEEHDRRLLTDAFTIWRTSFKSKAANKPAPRRRRVSARVELPVSSPRLSIETDEPPRRRVHPRRSVPAAGYYRAATTSPDRLGRGNDGSRDLRREGSVASEPAYDRLRSELREASRSGRRIVSDEQRVDTALVTGRVTDSRPTSELVRALQYGHR